MTSNIKRAFLDYQHRQIHYRIGGEGDPLLLLHMTPRSSDEFREVMPILAQKRWAIAMDLMGLGDSDQPPWVYSMTDYVKSIIALLDELKIKKCSILGSLTGGYMAAEVAATYPERVEKLILCNVFYFDPEGTDNITTRYKTGFQIQADGSHLMDRWLARVNYVGTGALNHRCVIEDLKCFDGPIFTGMAVAKYCPMAADRFQLIQAPTLVLSGTKALEPLEKAGLAKPEHQDWLSHTIPHSQRFELDGGTLWMMNQMPDLISTFVIDFLEHK